MATILYNNRPAVRPARAFNSVLNELLRDTLPATAEPATKFAPQADILESEVGFELHLALPGVSKEAVQIDFQEGRLSKHKMPPRSGALRPATALSPVASACLIRST
jgi:HSP20 family protein